MSKRVVSTVLPNHVLKLMSKDDRAKLGEAGMTSEEAAMKQEARSEKELQEQIVNYLHLRGVKRVVRSAMHRKTTTAAGTPDLLFVYHGTPCAWEVKTATGKLRSEQDEAGKDYMADGWLYHVIRSLDQAKAILDSGIFDMSTATDSAGHQRR